MMAVHEYLVMRSPRPVNEVDIFCRNENVDILYLRSCDRLKGFIPRSFKSAAGIIRKADKKKDITN